MKLSDLRTLAFLGGTGALAIALAGHVAAAEPNKPLSAAGVASVLGRTMTCGSTPTITSNTFWDYGGAIKGMIILNPRKLSKIPKSVRLYIYAHECGHQYVGGDETAADCYAVKRGRVQGWLSPSGLTEICNFFSSNAGDFAHQPGPVRCRAMRACYRNAGAAARGD